MARIRTIKPEFFFHEGLADLPFEARLAFIGLWTVADRDGRFVWRPKTLKAQVFPHDSNVDFEKILKLLVEGGFVEKYEVDHVWYGCVIKFTLHQKIDKTNERESQLPPSPNQQKLEGVQTQKLDESKTSASLEEDESKTNSSRGQVQGKERKGKEGKGRGKETEGKGSTVTTMPREEFEAFALSRAPQTIATVQEEEPKPPAEEDEGANYRSDPDVIHLGDTEPKPIRRRSDLLVQDFERRQTGQRPMSHIGAMLGGITAKPIQTESEDDIEAKRRLIRNQARGAA